MIISFGTDDQHYLAHAAALKLDCERLGLDHEIQIIPKWTDDTQEICAHKAQFIRERCNFWHFEMGLQSPVIWLDADSRILQTFEIPREGYDVGWCANPAAIEGRKELKSSGAAYAFAPTAAARRFLDMWADYCGKYRPGTPADHARFDDLISQPLPAVQLQEITASLTGRLEFYTQRGKRRLAV